MRPSKLRAMFTGRGGARLAVLIIAASLSTSGCGGRGAAVAESAGATDDARMIVEQVAPLIEQLAGEEKFSGVVLVAKDGRPIFQHASGLASREYNVANRADTRFNVASLGKMFTAVSIAQLAARGQLSYEDRVAKFLPDYPAGVAGKITIRHLLTHTSGLGSYWKDEFHEANHARFRSVRDYFPLFVNDPLEFEPGQKWAYSNAGYMVLGAIIEKVTGQTYFDYVKEHVFKRAGMNATDFYETDSPAPNIAQGYTRQNRYLPGAGDLSNNIFLSPVKGSPAGGAYSTAEDLLRFAEALRAHKLLDAESTSRVLKGIIEYAPDRKYGYGFANEIVGQHTVIFHDGGANGVSAQFEMYPASGHVVVVLSNYDHPAVTPVVKRLREVILQNRPS
jgi:CubicO group peptidase (beta-lactamase class C family)